MSRRLLEGDSKVWIKIDNTVLENTEALDIYKPRHGKNVSTDSLFTDLENKSEDKAEASVKIDKHRNRWWMAIGVGLLALIVSVTIVMVYF